MASSSRPLKMAPALIAGLIVLAGLAGTAYPAERSAGGVYAASDGKGEIRLLWFPVPEAWPAGWRLESPESAAPLADRIVPGGDAAALAKLAPEERKALQQFDGYLAEGAEGRKLGAVVFLLKATTSWDFARALGVGRTLSGVPAGPRSYRAVGLDRDGRPATPTLLSAPIDAAVPTPLPLPPAGLKATATIDGVSLSWTPPEVKGRLPVVSYLVFRDGGKESNRLLTARSIIVGPQQDGRGPVYLDRGAPLEEELAYRVFGVDVFGRRGEAAEVRVFTTDERALLPPLLLKGVAKADQVQLSWQPDQEPNRLGFLIERGFAHEGPYELLTEKPLKPGEDDYRDAGLVAGTYYFYRIRSVGPGGEVGAPSPPLRVRAAAAKLPRPEGLAAMAGRLGVRLTWRIPAERVEGFLVERWSKASGEWARLTARSTPKSVYEDWFPPHSSGTYRYRVRAVGYDASEGEPGREVEVTLSDTLGPQPPRITAIDGTGGRVLLRYEPSTDGDVDRVCVVRSSDPDSDGLVVGKPLAASATDFIDAAVRPGRRYWYRLVAFDKQQNRGDLGEPVSVVVAPPPIPVPKAPGLKSRSEPLPLVEISFTKPPAGLAVIVERSTAAGPWLAVAGPTSAASPVADLGVARGARCSYRLRYQAPDGEQGEPSVPADIVLP